MSRNKKVNTKKLTVLYALHDGRCQKCGRNVYRYHRTDSRFHDDRATVEHLTPVCKGGTNELDNLTLYCQRCNHEGGVALSDEKARQSNATHKQCQTPGTEPRTTHWHQVGDCVVYKNRPGEPATLEKIDRRKLPNKCRPVTLFHLRYPNGDLYCTLPEFVTPCTHSESTTSCTTSTEKSTVP